MRKDPLIIGIANDHAGIEFKHKIKQQLVDIKVKDDNVMRKHTNCVLQWKLKKLI
jgi:ribose 5-phosphate isomerase RpiB